MDALQNLRHTLLERRSGARPYTHPDTIPTRTNGNKISHGTVFEEFTNPRMQGGSDSDFDNWFLRQLFLPRHLQPFKIFHENPK